MLRILTIDAGEAMHKKYIGKNSLLAENMQNRRVAYTCNYKYNCLHIDGKNITGFPNSTYGFRILYESDKSFKKIIRSNDLSLGMIYSH